MTWAGKVCTELARLKAAGVTHFDVAWSYAMAEFPPVGMVGGPKYRRLDDEEPVALFLERRARMEWDGLCVDDFAAGLRALGESGWENHTAPVRSRHSHARA